MPTTIILWECCTDGPDGPFDPCGRLLENKSAILEELRRERVLRPDTYLAKHVVTRCASDEEQLDPQLN